MACFLKSYDLLTGVLEFSQPINTGEGGVENGIVCYDTASAVILPAGVVGRFITVGWDGEPPALGNTIIWANQADSFTVVDSFPQVFGCVFAK